MKQLKQFFLILCLTIVGGVSNAWAQTISYDTITINNIVYILTQYTYSGYTYSDNVYIIDFSKFDKETLIIPATVTFPGGEVHEVTGIRARKNITNNYIRKMIFKGRNYLDTYDSRYDVNCPNLQKIFFMTGNFSSTFEYPVVGENQPLDLYFKEVPSLTSSLLPPHPELCTAHVAMNDDDFAIVYSIIIYIFAFVNNIKEVE